MNTEVTKPWWQSTTILGALAVLAAIVLRTWVPDVTDQEILDVLTKIAQVAGAILAIFGRIRASVKINRARVI